MEDHPDWVTILATVEQAAVCIVNGVGMAYVHVNQVFDGSNHNTPGMACELSAVHTCVSETLRPSSALLTSESTHFIRRPFEALGHIMPCSAAATVSRHPHGGR